MMSVYLDKKLGINPRLVQVHCFACGQEKSDSIVLLGNKNHVSTCSGCGTHVYGGYTMTNPCPKCKNNVPPTERRNLDDHEKIHTNGICRECEGFMAQGVIFNLCQKRRERRKTHTAQVDGA